MFLSWLSPHITSTYPISSRIYPYDVSVVSGARRVMSSLSEMLAELRGQPAPPPVAEPAQDDSSARIEALEKSVAEIQTALVQSRELLNILLPPLRHMCFISTAKGPAFLAMHRGAPPPLRPHVMPGNFRRGSRHCIALSCALSLHMHARFPCTCTCAFLAPAAG